MGGARGKVRRRKLRGYRPRRPVAAKRERASEVFTRLQARYPRAECALHHRDAYELLVATILSAQCTDERVNMVTPEFYSLWPDPRALAPGARPVQSRATRRRTRLSCTGPAGGGPPRGFLFWRAGACCAAHS